MEKKVTILMSTYNGEKYLENQLESLLNQNYQNISIYVRDDGSNDKTHAILNKYQKMGKLKWYKGDNLKPARSFMDLIYMAPESDFYALCDQDDIWLEDKVKIAIEKLDNIDSNVPSLYYGKPRLVDHKLNRTKESFGINNYMTEFSEILVDSNATGCTFVFNKKLLCELKKKKPSYIIMHDDWIHKVCVSLDGFIFYDSDVHILYRQHSNNAIGINISFFKKIKNKIINSKKNRNIRLNNIISLYDCYGNDMNEKNKKLCLFIMEYKRNVKNKLKVLFSNKIKTKYFFRNIYFKYLILFNLY